MPLDAPVLSENAQDPDELLTPAEVAKLTKLTVRTLADQRWRGGGPEFHKLGKGRCAPVRYRRRDVDSWINERHA